MSVALSAEILSDLIGSINDCNRVAAAVGNARQIGSTPGPAVVQLAPAISRSEPGGDARCSPGKREGQEEVMISRALRYIGLVRRHREPETLLRRGLARQLQLRTAIHVGAHHAEELDLYNEIGLDAVLWVEASPTIYQMLKTRLAEAGTNRVRNVAVNAFAGETSGENLALRHFSNDGASNSIFASTDLFAQTWPQVLETGGSEDVVTARLDDIASDYGFSKPDLLNIDVQGAELLVLKGAPSVLLHAKAIIVEVSCQQFYAGGVLQPELKEFLWQSGFVQTRRPPVHGNQLFLRK